MIPKFRAWDKTQEIMIDYIISIDFIKKIITYDYEDSLDLTVRFDDVILMQSTGLTDMNGVEIYEGDIVRTFSNINKYTDPWMSDSEPEYELSTIVRSGACFMTTYKGDPSEPLDFTVSSMAKHLEVIDNIYENKELLEDKQ